MHELDRVWASHCIRAKEDKCFDRRLNGTVLGLDLVAGKLFLPKRARLLLLVSAFTELLQEPVASPHELASVVSSLQWVMLANRPMLSLFSAVYRFTLNDCDTRRRRLPTQVIE